MQHNDHHSTESGDLFRRIAESDDQKVFAVFFDRYHTKLLRYARLFMGSIEEAEDVVSDVLIKLLKNRRQTFSKENFVGYLFTCIKNQCMDKLKKKKRELPTVDVRDEGQDYFMYDPQTPLSQLIHNELTLLLRNRIEALPPKRWMVFKLIKEEQMSYRQVADLMDISERTVEVHLKLALQDIRETLTRYTAQPGDGGEQRNIS